MKKFLLLVLLSFHFLFATAQTTGDYQSFTSGNWSAASTWLRFNGSSFVAAASAPSSSDGVITILTGHIITNDNSITIDQTIVDAGGTLSHTSGVLTIANGVSDDIIINGNFNFTGGGGSIINGAGTLTINGTMEWQSGKIEANIILAAGSVSSKTTADQGTIQNSGVLTNNGTFNFNAGPLAFFNGTFNNNVSGTLNVAGDNSMSGFNGGTDNFNNAGTFIKSAGTGVATIGIPGSNSGIIEANSGTITSTQNFINTGNITGTRGNTFQVNGGNFQLNTGSTVTGQVTFHQAGGTTTVNASPSATTAAGSNFLFTGGGGSIINGGGSLAINGTMEWQSGKLQSNLIIATGGLLDKNTAEQSEISNSGVLSNNGIFNWNAGPLFFSNGTLNNNASGTFTATGNDAMSSNNTNNFANAGTFIKTNATGVTTIGIPANNSGTVKGLGTLDFASSFASNGIIAPGTSPGLLTINSSQPLSANSTLQIEMQDGSGPGTGHDQLIRNGNITLAGNLVVTETGTLPNGTYTIINLTSGTVSGSFSMVMLPAGYVLQVNASSVQITRNIVLPLTLLSFTGTVQNQTAQLQWQVTNEINTASFVIERSNGTTAYTSVGNVPARNVSGNNSYNFNDNKAFATGAVQLYRLQIIDKDGSFTYSKTIKLTRNGLSILSVYPNPVTDEIVISGLQQKGLLKIFNANGSLVQQQTVKSQTITLNIANYPKGIYFVKYLDGKNVISSQKIIRQ